MTLREFVFENLIGDLEYHPARGTVYLGLAVAAICVWIVAPTKSSAVPLVFFVGGLSLFLKAIFLFRKTSDGLGISQQSLGLSEQQVPERRTSPKAVPTLSASAAQVLQDFGTGAVLLGPVLHFVNNLDNSWNRLPGLPIFITGLALFGVGWLIRRAASPSTLPSDVAPRDGA